MIFRKFLERFLLKNVRRGFATNSSSSHSFVYMKESQDEKEDSEVFDYGWNDFRINTIRGKVLYYAAATHGYEWSGEDATELYDTYSDDYPELSEDDFNAISSGLCYVDHQSQDNITLYDARNPHTVIFGGNDNQTISSEMRLSAFNEIDWMMTDPGYDEEEAGYLDRIKDIVKRTKAKIKAEREERKERKARESDNPIKQYHISPDTDRPNICRARKRKCPLGPNEPHFITKEDARSYHEKKLKKEYDGGLSSVRKGKNDNNKI